MSLKVKNEVHIYSIDEKDTVMGENTTLEVTNVWNKKEFVYLQVTGGVKIAVKATELRKAIDNATNNEFY